MLYILNNLLLFLTYSNYMDVGWTLKECLCSVRWIYQNICYTGWKVCWQKKELFVSIRSVVWRVLDVRWTLKQYGCVYCLFQIIHFLHNMDSKGAVLNHAMSRKYEPLWPNPSQTRPYPIMQRSNNIFLTSFCLYNYYDWIM